MYKLTTIVLICLLTSGCLPFSKYRPFVDDSGELWGIEKTISNKVLLEPSYRYLDYAIYYFRFIAVDSLGQYGIINKKGKTILPFNYTSIQEPASKFDTMYYLIVKDKQSRYGMVKAYSGRLVLPCEYEKLEVIGIEDIQNKEAFIRVYRNGKYGVVNLRNKTIVPIGFDEIEYVKSTGFIVRERNQYGVVNMKGKINIPIEYDSIEYIDKLKGYKLTKGHVIKLVNKYGELTP